MPPKNGEPTCYRCKHLKIFVKDNVDGEEQTWARCGLGLWATLKVGGGTSGKSIQLASLRKNNALHAKIAAQCGKFAAIAEK